MGPLEIAQNLKIAIFGEISMKWPVNLAIYKVRDEMAFLSWDGDQCDEYGTIHTNFSLGEGSLH